MLFIVNYNTLWKCSSPSRTVKIWEHPQKVYKLMKVCLSQLIVCKEMSGAFLLLSFCLFICFYQTKVIYSGTFLSSKKHLYLNLKWRTIWFHCIFSFNYYFPSTTLICFIPQLSRLVRSCLYFFLSCLFFHTVVVLYGAPLIEWVAGVDCTWMNEVKWNKKLKWLWRGLVIVSFNADDKHNRAARVIEERHTQRDFWFICVAY